MARDVCRDCKQHFPFGEGLKGGRCSACRALLQGRRVQARKAAKPVKGKKEE